MKSSMFVGDQCSWISLPTNVRPHELVTILLNILHGNAKNSYSQTSNPRTLPHPPRVIVIPQFIVNFFRYYKNSPQRFLLLKQILFPWLNRNPFLSKYNYIITKYKKFALCITNAIAVCRYDGTFK